MSGLVAGLQAFQEVTDLRLQFLERLSNPAPLSERYVEGLLNVHRHIGRRGEDLGAGVEIRARIGLGRNVHSGEGLATSSVERNEFSMLVLVREVGKQLRPVDSLVRLYRLDQVAALRGDTLEEGLYGLSIREAPGLAPVKPILVGLDGELRITLAPREHEYRVIKRGPEVVGDFSDPDAEVVGRGIGSREFHDLIAGLNVTVEEDEIALLGYGLQEAFDIRQVFTCPSMPNPGGA